MNRIHVRVVDAAGALRGATSVSVRSAVTGSPGEPSQWQVLGGGSLRGAIPPGLPADIWGFNDPSSITSAWNSGCFDAPRGQMYVLGGGHADGAYNGVFAYDLSSQTWQRFTEAEPRLSEGAQRGIGEHVQGRHPGRRPHVWPRALRAR